jgi:hypothetical protein
VRAHRASDTDAVERQLGQSQQQKFVGQDAHVVKQNADLLLSPIMYPR